MAAAEEPVLVDSADRLEAAAAAWEGCTLIGLDTEFVRERTYRAALGLVQISDGNTAWLVDPVKVQDLSPLVTLLEDPNVEKVIHSGSEDFEVMYHALGAVPRSILDSQIACAMLGQSLQLGYHNAANWLLDVEVDKDHTRSNWLRRPLSAGQLRYAALDVTLLPLMMEHMREPLERQGRLEWLNEEVERMAKKSATDLPPDEAWMRVGGAGSLNDNQRKVLQALAAWREQKALEKDLARGFVVTDSALLGMAKSQPDSTAELKRIEGLHPRDVSRYGEILLEIIGQAQSAAEVAPLPQLDNQQRQLIKTMRTRVAQAAKELDVDAALLASRKQMENLIFTYSDSKAIPERFTGWRMDVITRDLIDLLDD